MQHDGYLVYVGEANDSFTGGIGLLQSGVCILDLIIINIFSIVIF